MKTSGIARSVFAAAFASMLLAGCAGDAVRDKAAIPAAAAAVAVAPATTATTALVSGRVPVVGGGAPSIVILRPTTAKELPGQPSKPVMDQVSLTFSPAVMFVRTGQPTEFRNSDDVLHNVRVREEATKEGTFNVALPTGGAYQHIFARDGFYDVGCDIHPGMAAVVVAASTPYAVLADAEGNYSIADVPPGGYAVTVYAGTQMIERQVEVTAGAFQLDIAS
jgi:plastocyanin